MCTAGQRVSLTITGPGPSFDCPLPSVQVIVRSPPVRQSVDQPVPLSHSLVGRSQYSLPVPPLFPSDSQERALSSMRVSHDPRGRYCDEDEDEAAEEDSGRRSRSPDSPRVPVVIGPWLKMAADFADKKDANGDSDDFVGVGLYNLNVFHYHKRRLSPCRKKSKY